MNLRFPQALIRIDISDAAQHALVQQQRLDPRASPANPVREFYLAHFKRIGAESGQLFGKQCLRQVSNAPKTPRIGVAQFAPIIQKYANVCVLLKSSPRRTRRDLAGHSQMYQQRRLRRIAICGNAGLSIDRRQPQQYEFPIAFYCLDLAPGQVLLQRGRIIDKISLTEPDRNYPPPENCLPQYSRYRFDFGKFRHKGRKNLQNSTAPHPMLFGQGANPRSSGRSAFCNYAGNRDRCGGAACRGGCPHAGTLASATSCGNSDKADAPGSPQDSSSA